MFEFIQNLLKRRAATKAVEDLSEELKETLSEEIDEAKKRQRTRGAEILSVFAMHNFYANGFTPEELRTTLEDLGPTYVKIGQIMSSRVNMLPEEYCEELKKLRSTVKPLDAAVARGVIEQETGKRIEEIYAEFRDEPIGSASIAQAHSGVLLDGRKVVTKVQRPLIAGQMRKDFVLLKKIASAVNTAQEESGGGTVDLVSVITELEKVTEEELDFRIEAENTRQFREKCIEDDAVISCPTIIDELTTERMLTMTFVEGYSIAKKERVEAEGYDRVAIGTAIAENYLHQILDVGMFHGDPHQGNIMISHGVPVWIDFGMIGHISDESIDAIQRLLLAVLRKDLDGVVNAALSVAVVQGELNRPKLLEDVDAFCESHGSLSNISGMQAGAMMSDLTAILSKHRIRMPGEYTMLIRGLVTIEGVLKEFCPELNLFEFLTKKLIQRAKDQLDVRQTLISALEALVSTGLQTTRLSTMAADVLKNLVKGKTKINFALTGYEDALQKLTDTVKHIVLAIFACVLFSGSCVLCTTDVQPQTNGMPVLALGGFVVSIALAIYTIRKMKGKK